MANIVIVTGSVRQVNVNAGIVDIIAAEVNLSRWLDGSGG